MRSENNGNSNNRPIRRPSAQYQLRVHSHTINFVATAKQRRTNTKKNTREYCVLGKKMRHEKVKREAMELMGSFQVLPRLVVFDLDYTLWPFYCAYRSKREIPSLYPHAKGIIYALKEKGVDLAIASRSPTAERAKAFLDKLEISSMFITQEIFFSWTKTGHFQRINHRTGVPFNSMLFFDDEDWNIETVSKMGVTSILVGNGVTFGALRQGLTKFSQNASSLGKSKQIRNPPFFSAILCHKPTVSVQPILPRPPGGVICSAFL